MNWLSGKIFLLEQDLFLIKNDYFGFEVFYSGPMDQQDFYIQTIYQEKDRQFYAFATYEEKSFFQDLLKITGIGPKTAFNLMKNRSLEEIFLALEEGDKNFFKGLSSKVINYLLLEFGKKIKRKIHPKEEELIALTNQLGLKKDLVLKALKKHSLHEETEILLKKVLKDINHVIN